MNNRKLTEKLAGPRYERRFPFKNCNLVKNVGEKEKRKAKNDVTELDDERGLQQVEGELDIVVNGAIGHTNLPIGRQRTKKTHVHYELVLDCHFATESELSRISTGYSCKRSQLDNKDSS